MTVRESNPYRKNLIQSQTSANTNSASQISIYVSNIRALNPSIMSGKFTWPMDSKCDVYIFVDARMTELKLSTLRPNFKVRMSDLQCYSSNSKN